MVVLLWGRWYFDLLYPDVRDSYFINTLSVCGPPGENTSKSYIITVEQVVPDVDHLVSDCKHCKVRDACMENCTAYVYFLNPRPSRLTLL